MSMCLLLKWQTGARPAEWFAQKTPADAKRFLESTFPWLQIPEEAAGSLLTQRPSKSMSVRRRVTPFDFDTLCNKVTQKM